MTGRERTFSTHFSFESDKKNTDPNDQSSPRKTARQNIAELAKKTMKNDMSYTNLQLALKNLQDQSDIKDLVNSISPMNYDFTEQSRVRSHSFNPNIFKRKVDQKVKDEEQKNKQIEEKIPEEASPKEDLEKTINPKHIDDVYDWNILTDSDHVMASLKQQINLVKMTGYL